MVKNIDAQTKIEGWFHVGIIKKHLIIYITDITASPKHSRGTTELYLEPLLWYNFSI